MKDPEKDLYHRLKKKVKPNIAADMKITS